MFQFRRFPTYTYFIQYTLTEYGSAGFPHSDISGSSRMCRSPKLIAACHVLHRLLMPRHSPCALCSLTFDVAFTRKTIRSMRRYWLLELCKLTEVFRKLFFTLCCPKFRATVLNSYTKTAIRIRISTILVSVALLRCFTRHEATNTFVIVQFSRCIETLSLFVSPAVSIRALV